jgi:hypothetical protein
VTVRTLSATAAALLLALATASPTPLAAAARPRKKSPAPVKDGLFSVIGTIRYDTGVNAGFHPDMPSGAANLNRIVGNRFDSQLGFPLLLTQMVTMVTVFPANDGLQSVSILGTPTTMNTAVVLDYQAANLMAGQFNAIAIGPPVTVGPDFLAVFLGTFNASQPLGLVGMSDMGTMGQGFHAIQGFYFGAGAGSIMLGTMLEAVPARNAMVRATVDPLVPVELIDFKIE